MFYIRINDAIHAGFGDSKFFELKLLDKYNRVKKSIQLNGNDKPSDSKYNNLNFTKFEDGDTVEVYYVEPFRLNISGNSQSRSMQSYKIVNSRLRANG